jgi:hypothetical protein
MDKFIDFEKTNLKIRGVGLLALQNSHTDEFEFVTQEIYNSVNYNENNDYVLNYITLSIEDKDYELKDDKIHTQEIPRCTINISTIFFEVDSIKDVIYEGYDYFEQS